MVLEMLGTMLFTLSMYYLVKLYWFMCWWQFWLVDDIEEHPYFKILAK